VLVDLEQAAAHRQQARPVGLLDGVIVGGHKVPTLGLQRMQRALGLLQRDLIGGLILFSQLRWFVGCFVAQPFTTNRLLPLLTVATMSRRGA
jgi:hypothetical protein